jgi:hypothetical protein
MKTTVRQVRLTTICRTCVIAALLSVFAFGVVRAPGAQYHRDVSQRGNDFELFAGVVARLQSGTPYYTAMASELRAREYPSASVMNWRTPLHLSSLAMLGVPLARLTFVALGLALVVVGAAAFAPRGRRGTAWGAFCVAGAAVLPAGWSQLLIFLPEAWCGLLIGLSLAFYARRNWLMAAGCGILAVFVRELAAPYVLVCGVAAILARRRRESLLWVLGGVSYVAYYAYHAASTYAAIEPGAFAHSHGWLYWQGLPFVFSTAACYAWTFTSPFLVPLVVAGGLAAVTAPAAPVQLRSAMLAYLCTFAVVGQPFNMYWGFATTPLWAFGLAYSVDGLRWIADMPRTDSGSNDSLQPGLRSGAMALP